jgi:hypothetical protein
MHKNSVNVHVISRMIGNEMLCRQNRWPLYFYYDQSPIVVFSLLKELHTCKRFSLPGVMPRLCHPSLVTDRIDTMFSSFLRQFCHEIRYEVLQIKGFTCFIVFREIQGFSRTQMWDFPYRWNSTLKIGNFVNDTDDVFCRHSHNDVSVTLTYILYPRQRAVHSPWHFMIQWTKITSKV